MSINLSNAGRRKFLQRTAASAASGIACPLTLNLSAIGKLAAAECPAGQNDYKALVCVFLYGANDHYNTIVPYDQSNYGAYVKLRQMLALKRSDLHGTVMGKVKLDGEHEFAFNENLKDLHTLWENNKVATLMNVGPLIEPTKKRDYTNKTVRIPSKIFSHNDQQSIWQSLSPEGAVDGWGGRFADLMLSDYGNSGANDIFSTVSINGNSLFLSGRESSHYTLSTEGVIQLVDNRDSVYGSPDVAKMMATLMSSNSDTHLMSKVLASTSTRAIEAGETLKRAFTDVPDLTTEFASDSGGLSEQLAVVAKMIAVGKALQMKRQVFFVSAGGFDLHDALVPDHPRLLKGVNDALKSFYDSTANDLNCENQVTTFTASEFGRTLTGNGDGSDHGWGSHHFIVGGSVNPGFYGDVPVLGDNKENDVGRGRLLPTSSVDQFAATLGSWFGVCDDSLLTALPNLENFNKSDWNLGFMKHG